MSKRYYERNKAKWRGYYKTRRHKAPLYAAWRSMMTRCGLIEGGKARDLRRYRDRGISVCEQWRDYNAYERWAFENGWASGLQVDRIDNDGNYEPSNCRFVTARGNACNRSDTIFVEYNGRRMSLRSAYDAFGCKLDYKLVNNRVRKGWSLMRALGAKKMRPRNPIRCKTAAAFESDFAAKFGGRRVLKTAFHFFNWATNGKGAERERLFSAFTTYCRRNHIRASWRNAAEWYERVQRGVVNGVGA